MKRILARFGWVLAVIALLTAVTYLLHDRPALGVDDANIFVVYGENLASGAGLVYNRGGERVEGYTSTLWMLVSALVRVLGPVERGLLAASVLLVSASLTAASLHVDTLLAPNRPGGSLTPYSGACLVLVLSSPAYVTWMTVTLMDAALWGALLVSAAVILSSAWAARRRSHAVWLSVTLGLMVLARPEAMAVGPLVLLLYALAMRRHCPSWREVVRGVRSPAAVFALVLAGLTTFRLAYFGYPLPNTFYAKVSPSMAYNLSEGWRYLWGYLASSPLVALTILALAVHAVLAVASLSFGRKRGPRRRGWKVFDPRPMLPLALLLVPVATGGDHFRWYRHYQPVYPLLVLGVFQLGHFARDTLEARLHLELSRGQHAALVVAGIGLILTLGHGEGWASLAREQPLGRELAIAEEGYAAGESVAQLFGPLPSLPSVGQITAGAFKRGYIGPLIDLMGLNNLAMAHTPGDRRGMKNHAAFSRDVFLAQQPDVVQPGVGACQTLADRYDLRFAGGVLKGLFDDPRFLETYRLVQVRRVGDGDQCLIAYMRRGFVDELVASGAYRIDDVVDAGRDAEDR